MKRFVAGSALALVASTAVFALALHAGASPQLATLLRLAIAVPIAIRMLAPRDRLWLGLAIGVAAGAKLAIEPLVIALLGNQPLFAPVVADAGYGPLITYLLVRSRLPRLAAVAA